MQLFNRKYGLEKMCVVGKSRTTTWIIQERKV